MNLASANPRHVAIIMDGNGRWAQQRKKVRSAGHRKGVEVAKTIVQHCLRQPDVKVLSLFVFSTENWKRPQKEVSFLMELIVSHLRRELTFYEKNQIRILHSGDLTALPAEVQNEILQAQKSTASFSGLTVNLLINYGGRAEIVRAAQRCLSALGDVPSEQALARYFDHREALSDVDLLIRTSGESRISNCLLWQSAYAEFFYSEKLWPDWTPVDLDQALRYYRDRRRRYGGLEE